MHQSDLITKKPCIFAMLLGISIILVLSENSSCVSVESNELRSVFKTNDLNPTYDDTDEDTSTEVVKKAIDKMRFYGGLGKRLVDSELSENQDQDSVEVNDISKRLDKMKYFGGLGKRRVENSNEFNKGKRLDKMKYFGGLGKKRAAEKAKKSRTNIDRLRFLGNLGK